MIGWLFASEVLPLLGEKNTDSAPEGSAFPLPSNFGFPRKISVVVVSSLDIGLQILTVLLDFSTILSTVAYVSWWDLFCRCLTTVLFSTVLFWFVGRDDWTGKSISHFSVMFIQTASHSFFSFSFFLGFSIL